MTNVISITAWKNKQLEKQYTAYHGTPIDIKYVKRPQFTVIQTRSISEEEAMAALQGSIDIAKYMDSMKEELALEGINIDSINVIKPDPTIPW